MKKIVALGDSLTWGFPYGPDASWVCLLSRVYPDITWINQGVNGDTFAGLLWRLERDVLLEKPDMCLVEAGVNDAFTLFSMAEIEMALEGILVELKRHGVKPALVLPLNVEVVTGPVGKLSEIRTLLESKAKKHALPLLDFQVLEARHFVDEVHPNREGYEVIARALAKQFEALGLLAP